MEQQIVDKADRKHIFSLSYYRKFENAASDIAGKKNSLFGTIPPEERRTLGTVTFCSTAVTETGDVDEFFFHFENGIVVCVERVKEDIEELREKNHDI